MHDQADIGAGQGPDVAQSKGFQTRLIIFGVAALAAIIFVAQNREEVTIHFLFIDVTARVWIGFVICLALGALLGALVGRWWRRRQTQ
jgi:uncharacterized integral membrane protein